MKMKNRNQKKTNGASHAGDRVDLRAQNEKRAYDLGLADGFKLNVNRSGDAFTAFPMAKNLNGCLLKNFL